MQRQITHVHKDNNDVITQCYSSGEWQSVAEIIAAIENSTATYYTNVNGNAAWVTVVHGTYSKYLRSTPDGTTVDNLDMLPTA